MRALLTSPSFKRPALLVMALCWLALMSTGDPYFYLLAALTGGVWLCGRLARELPALDRLIFKMMGTLLTVLALMSVIIPLISTFSSPTQNRIMTTWLWAGFAMLAWVTVQVWRSPRWSVRRERWSIGLAMVSLWLAAAMLGEGHRSVLKGKDYRHSKRLAVIGLAALYLALNFFAIAKLGIFFFTSSGVEEKIVTALALSLTVWLATVLLSTIDKVKVSDRADFA